MAKIRDLGVNRLMDPPEPPVTCAECTDNSPQCEPHSGGRASVGGLNHEAVAQLKDQLRAYIAN